MQNPENFPANPIKNLPGLPAPTLYRAARLLEQAADFPNRQWTQGAKARDCNGRPTGLEEYRSALRPPAKYCAVGHLERVCEQSPEDRRYQPLLLNRLAQQIHDSIAHWNDEPERTAQDVRELFREVAQALYQEAVAAGLKAAAAAPEPERELEITPEPGPAETANREPAAPALAAAGPGPTRKAQAARAEPAQPE